MKNSYIVVGMMSGTSLDGLDMACCEFVKDESKWTYELLATDSIHYNSDCYHKLKEAIHLPKADIDSLDQLYGKWLGERVNEFIHNHKLEVDAIASHGHTVFHQPAVGITVQVGSGQQIANITGKKVICDFRKRDVSLGGQGAPLVPIGDELLFGHYAACLNMGGIANISYNLMGDRIAFDIVMANMLLNYLSEQLNKPYDESGLIARSGTVNKDLLEALNNLAYYKLPYPKSTGYEWFLSEVKPIIDNSDISIKDKLATSVEHEAKQIGNVLQQHIEVTGDVLVTGGGAFNTFFIDRLKSYTPAHLNIIVPDNQLILFKEALVFAFLGVLRLRQEKNCLRTVTGASCDSCGGDVFIPILCH